MFDKGFEGDVIIARKSTETGICTWSFGHEFCCPSFGGGRILGY
jgi:hypothetical protein